jgi:hypothetical protein
MIIRPDCRNQTVHLHRMRSVFHSATQPQLPPNVTHQLDEVPLRELRASFSAPVALQGTYEETYWRDSFRMCRLRSEVSGGTIWQENVIRGLIVIIGL